MLKGLSRALLALSVLVPAVRAANPSATGELGEGVPKFWVRPGYRVTLAAKDFGEARFLETDGNGTIFVSQPRAGSIVALTDKDGDGVYETHSDFITGHKTVHGMFFRDGWLWFTESGAIFKTKPTADGKAGEVITVIPDGQLPKGGGHWWRSICITDQYLFTSIGDNGNINDHSADTDDREKVWRFKLDGSDKTLWCGGIRNTEKLRIRPGTDELWGADHGSDWYGQKFGDKKGDQPVTDENPPEEFNHYIQGGFYGHPFIVGNKLPRLEFADRPDIIALADKTIPPAWAGGAHWANNGWTFLTHDGIGEKGDALIAYHGSWNSLQKVGYRVQRICFDAVTGLPYGALPIVTTLSDDGKDVLDRPVDCLELPDGSVLFSSDTSNNIYRITKAGK